MSTQIEEWRVTGQPGTVVGTKGEPVVTFPPYDVIWTDERARRHAPLEENTGEKAARGYIARVAAGTHRWEDGPHLHRRTVVYGDWTDA